MSDHGAQAMQGGICINEWLVEQGYLTLSRPSDGAVDGQRVKLDQCAIDWSKTKAWGAGGYYGRLFLNVKGREPQGILPPDQVEAFKDEITAKLEAIADPQGRNIGTRVLRPEQAYREINNIPPDLIVYFGDLAWRSVGSIGDGSIHVFENDTGPDDANHAQEGMYIVALPFNSQVSKSATAPLTSRQTKHTWRAIAPTMLDILGLDAPADMSKERLYI
jgi:predicted AlkP superfamily phosphohydrolase/phosphomutase